MQRFAIRLDFEAEDDLGLEALRALADAGYTVLKIYRATQIDETFYVNDEQVDEEGDPLFS